MDKFDIAQDFTARWEGGLSDDKADRGGLTNYGVCIEFLKDFASSDDKRTFLASLGVHPLPVTRDTIRNLTIPQARAIFKREFWDSLHLDDMPIQMGVLLYDAAVNSGRSRSVKLAQRGFNAVSAQKSSLAVDGILGPLTRAALANNNTREVRSAIVTARENFYKDIVRNNASQYVFLKGWLNRAADLRRYMEAL